MEEWKEYKLKDVTSVLGDGIHGTPKYDENGAVFFINGNNLENGKIIIKENTRRVSVEESIKYRKPLTDRTILVSINGTLGNVARYNGEPCILGKSACYFNVKEEFDLIFIYYVVANGEFRKDIERLATGTTIKNVSLETMRNYTFYAPSLKTQKQIASILKSLDDKIEVNRKINENLEQQAQALFKSWFVDFEPFKNGEFVESELGMIPKGWRVGKLGELCQFKRGKGLLSKNAIPGDVPVVAGGLEPACYHNTSNTKAPVITVSGSGANAGFMRMYHQEVWASDCSFIDITCENWLFVYCFLAINSHLLKHAQTGAVQPHVKPADIHDFDLAIPPKEYIQRFQDKISSFITKKGLIEQESRRLAELRDTLLPRLMSGDLRVTDMDLVNKLMENNIF